MLLATLEILLLLVRHLLAIGRTTKIQFLETHLILRQRSRLV